MTKQAPSLQWLALQLVPAIHGRTLVISVPKRIVPLSTRRSRLKRLIRESVRLQRLKPASGTTFRFAVRAATPQGLDLQTVAPLVLTLVEKESK